MTMEKGQPQKWKDSQYELNVCNVIFFHFEWQVLFYFQVLKDEKIVGEKSVTVPLKPQPWKWECRPVRGAACAGDDETVHTGHMAHWALPWWPVVRWRPVIGWHGRRVAWLQWDVTGTRTHTSEIPMYGSVCVCVWCKAEGNTCSSWWSADLLHSQRSPEILSSSSEKQKIKDESLQIDSNTSSR